MTSGRVLHWHKAEGEEIQEEELLLDIASDNVPSEGFDVGKWGGEVAMQVECHEDGYIAKILPHSGAGSDAVPVGTPLALICDEEGDVARVRQWTAEGGDPSEHALRDATWQAYVKSQGAGPDSGMCGGKGHCS